MFIFVLSWFISIIYRLPVKYDQLFSGINCNQVEDLIHKLPGDFMTNYERFVKADKSYALNSHGMGPYQCYCIKELFPDSQFFLNYPPVRHM